jgi:Type II restriction endonuclease EcoO109I
LDGFLLTSEETNFGNFLEALAIFINSKVYGGVKSKQTGIDLEFEKDGTKYFVSIKSGPKWGNSDQITKMVINFYNIKQIFSVTHPSIKVVTVNGCCYGKDQKPLKVTNVKTAESKIIPFDYLKLCGQSFWTFISGIDSLYVDIVEPLGYRAKEKNEAFLQEYDKVSNLFVRQFTNEFCDETGAINWKAILELNSGGLPPIALY